MFKKSVIIFITMLLSAAMLFSAAACMRKNPYGTNEQTDYNRHPTDYDPDINSWEQIDPGDKDVDITWFMDYAYANQNLESLIFKRTGVRVKFQNALTNDHSELNTAIAGGKLPDVISIDNTSLRIQLAEEGYCYAMNKLAESYAPSLLSRVSKEHWDYYKSTDGNTYSLASNFYNDEEIEEFEQAGGNQYANGGLVVRKDYMDAYIAHMKAENPSFNPDTAITKPSGFLDMAKWVKRTYNIPNTVPTIALSPFKKTATNDIFSQSLLALMEFMGVPMEDANGDLVYQYGTAEFLSVVKVLNEMYRSNLIISDNFAYEIDDLTTMFLNGRPFAYLGADQEIRSAFAKREQTGYSAATKTIAPGYEYVSIMLTNEKGDAPLMMDYAGRGLYSVMITKNCAREDRVIKVIDYMMSEQGMREMSYGEIEGEYYNFTVRPGEINPKTGKPSKYGIIEPTDKMKRAVANGFSQSVSALGFGRMWQLVNPLYPRLTSEHDDYAGIIAPWYWTVYKNKKTYFGHTFSRVPFRYPLDVSDRKALMKYTDRQSAVEKVWIEALPQFIMASSSAEVETLYQKAYNLSLTKGAMEWLAFRNACFKEHKDYLGVEYAWPKADPDYTGASVKLYGNAADYADRPIWVYEMI